MSELSAEYIINKYMYIYLINEGKLMNMIKENDINSNIVSTRSTFGFTKLNHIRLSVNIKYRFKFLRQTKRKTLPK